MFVYRSNHAETLLGALADVVARPPHDPLRPECIVVQGRGMERWVAMELGRRLGVWAHPDFPFPRTLLERAFTATLGEPEGADPYAPAALTWAVARAIEALADVPALRQVTVYLGGAPPSLRDTRLLELASHVAATFDRYVVHRPELLERWERGSDDEPDDWQPALWRHLAAQLGPRHFAARARRWLAALPSLGLPGFAPRVSLFGTSALAPLYLELLAALATQVEVHLFVLSPSREYWAEVRSHRQHLRELVRAARSGAGAEAVALEPAIDGAPALLASLGEVGRDFQQLLEGSVDYVEPAGELYFEPQGRGMLTTLQADLLHLRSRGPGGDAPAVAVAPDDRSISVHACHSPGREVEVLHDLLLGALEDDPSLQPHDIVVLTPSIDTYAPYVEAVFAGGGGSGEPLPFRIADRRPRATSEVLDAFERVLDLAVGRLGVDDVLELLALRAVQRRFELHADDLERVRRWLLDAGVRWGRDGADRAAHGQPELAQNTWRFGLDRLLLGYAAPGAGRGMFAGVLPHDDIEGTEAAALGRLCDLCETLFELREVLGRRHSLEQWRGVLDLALERMVAQGDDNAAEHQQLREATARLADTAAAAGFTRPVDLGAVRAALAPQASPGAQAAPAFGLVSGGVTICDLVPMRAIPFRVVCLLGMNDQSFPRLRRPPSFDRTAQRPRVGDRSSRSDDRYLFLEAILSARQRLIITYVGQSQHDGAELPPAVVVSELLDALEASFSTSEALPAPPALAGAAPRGAHRAPEAQLALPLGPAAAAPAAAPAGASAEPPPSLRRRLVVPHPLQPFSPRYFASAAPGRDARLFSFVDAYRAGAEKLGGARGAVPSLFAGLLPEDPALMVHVSLDALVRFFEHPTRAFVRDRLGIKLGPEAEVVVAREPQELSALDAWRLGDELLRRLLAGETFEGAVPSLEAGGALPPGTVGRLCLRDVRPEVEVAYGAVRPWLRGERLPPVEVDGRIAVATSSLGLGPRGVAGAIAGTRVTGVLRDLWPQGQVHWGFSKLGRRSELGVWIRHLALCWAAPPDHPRTTRITGRPPADGAGTMVAFAPVQEPAAVLADLLRVYALGQRAALPLFSSSSRAYAEALHRGDSPAWALRQAEDFFRKGYWRLPKERDDPYIHHVFANTEPLDPAYQVFADDASAAVAEAGFCELAERVYAPMLQHRQEAR